MPSSVLQRYMVPAGGDELPRVRRAVGSQKKLGLTIISQFVSVGRSRRPQSEVN